MKRVGLLTSGGDCQALNATMRGISKALYNMYGDEVEIVGFLDGYKGLIYEDYIKLSPADFSGILTKGGTILGTSRQPFKDMRTPDANGLDKVEAMKTTYRRLRLDCLYVLGGNGSQKTANLLSEEGLNVIGMPKTIDNDLWGTDTTFGFQSAIDVATNAMDAIHTTAASHNRCFIVEIMGHKAGWLTLNAGMASGADIILIPEIPYDIDNVIKAVQNRNKRGRGFTIIAVAEGAMTMEDAGMKKKEYKKRVEDMLRNYPSISYEIADQIKAGTGLECRVTVPGHMQRGGQPNAYDRVLSSRLGTYGAILFSQGKFGEMVAIRDHKITSVPLSEVAGKLKTVPIDSDIITEARMLGISFGDR
ncbi:MAG: 6-phosphofructokinase [Clostridiales bacterium]|nr:6-phosphofructokinase [Clostridiales bacterium]MCC8099350.1 6-phosphofructokinase [Clostridiales bacterium]